MLALEPLIVARLASALGAGWHVAGDSTPGNRPVDKPTATVRWSGCAVADTKTGAVNVAPGWAVLLVVRKSDQAAATLDAAFATAVRALHDWAPATQPGQRRWHPLALEQTAPPQFADDGLIGLESIYTTHARYDGATQ